MKSQRSKFRHLSSKDLELISTLCERVHYTNPNEPFSNHAFVVLKNAISSTQFSVDRYRTDPLVLEGALSEGVSNEFHSVYKAYVHQHPLLHLFLAPGQSSFGTILTETSGVEFRKKVLYMEFYRKLGVEDQLAFSLPHKDGVYVIAYSRDRAFTEKEQTIMQVIRPHMQIAWQNWQRIRELEQRLQLLEGKAVISEESAKQACEAKQLMDRLSPRERDVAELVAQGMENRKIAETLHISPKTVGKHLENIFTALNLHHRAALAAKWRQSGHAS
jgi:DNA-binding CsgD family transcriptional regulator